MAGPEEILSLPGDDPSKPRSGTQKTDGSGRAFGLLANGERSARRVTAKFFRSEPVEIQEISIEGSIDDLATIKQIAGVMGTLRADRVELAQELVPLETETEADATLQDGIESEIETSWGPRWPSPSVITLDMQRDNPGLLGAIKARMATFWRFPFARRDSE